MYTKSWKFTYDRTSITPTCSHFSKIWFSARIAASLVLQRVLERENLITPTSSKAVLKIMLTDRQTFNIRYLFFQNHSISCFRPSWKSVMMIFIIQWFLYKPLQRSFHRLAQGTEEPLWNIYWTETCKKLLFSCLYSSIISVSVKLTSIS